MFGLLHAHPGTRLYERLQHEGRLVNEFSGDYAAWCLDRTQTRPQPLSVEIRVNTIGSIAMGLGGYLAARSDAEHYAKEKAIEQLEVETIPDVET